MNIKLASFVWNFVHANFKTNQQKLTYYLQKHTTTLSLLASKIRQWKYKVSSAAASFMCDQWQYNYSWRWKCRPPSPRMSSDVDVTAWSSSPWSNFCHCSTNVYWCNWYHECITNPLFQYTLCVIVYRIQIRAARQPYRWRQILHISLKFTGKCWKLSCCWRCFWGPLSMRTQCSLCLCKCIKAYMLMNW